MLSSNNTHLTHDEMKYDIIFYISRKTAYCEKALVKALSEIDAEKERAVYATSPTELGEEVCESLRRCPLAVIIGGLSSMGDENLSTVLSRVFSNSGLTLKNMRKITASSKKVGYVIRYKGQILLALPDSPEDIGEILSQSLLRYIREKLEGN